MLEVFFDNEKSFSVLKILLEADDYITPADIGEKINITPREVSKVLKNFEILDIVEVRHLIFYSINVESPILFSIACLDDLVCNYIYGKHMSDKKEENGNFQNALMNVSDEMSLEEFVEMLENLK